MDVVQTLRSHRHQLEGEIARIDRAIAILGNGSTPRTQARSSNGRHMSAAARRRIGAGVRRAHRLKNGKAVKGAK
jgi:hypothetical protein